MHQPNLPYSKTSVFSITCTPEVLNDASNTTRFYTLKFSMNVFTDGVKYSLVSGKKAKTV